MIRARSWRAWIWLGALTATCAGGACGYALSAGGAPPKGVERIQVRPFLDRTAEGDLGATVAGATRQRMREIDPGLVAGLREEGAANLEGSIEAVRFRTVPMGREGRVVPGLYQLQVIARARITSPGGRLIEDLGEFSERVEYPVESGVGPAEEARRRALLRAAREIGERIAERALIRF